MRSSARYFPAFLAQKLSESAVRKTSSVCASSIVLPVSSTIVCVMRSRFCTSQLRIARMTSPRASKPIASQAGCAARALRASSAICSAPRSGTCAMVSPVAGFSTAIVAPLPAPLVVACSRALSTVAMPALSSFACGRTSLTVELNALENHRLLRHVSRVGGLRLDRVDRVHPVRHLAEHGVLSVQPRCFAGGHDEELAAVRVRSRVGHRERAAHDLVVVDLVLERVAGPARAGAERAAALDHEVLDHAVEAEAVVEAVCRQLAKVLHRLRRVLVEELDLDGPVVRVQRRRAHLPATSTRSSMPRTRCPFTFSTTSPARSAGTSAKLKRSSTRTPPTSSPSRCEWSTMALTTSAGSIPWPRPAPTISLVRGVLSRSRRGLVCLGRLVSGFASRTLGGPPFSDHASISVFACRSTAWSSRLCFGVTRVIARPLRPTRPVRPMRCT